MELEGWGPVAKAVARGALRFPPRPKIAAGSPPIRVLRALAVTFTTSLLLMLLPMWFIYDGRGPDAGQAAVWIWAGLLPVAVTGFFAMKRAKDRAVAMAPGPGEALVRYRERLFLLVALGQAPALVAFVVFFAADTFVPYLVTLPVSLALIAYASPRAEDVRRLQARIDERGGTVDLAAALMGTV